MILAVGGWRISELTSLKWADVDLDKATAVTRGDTNKGRRDELIPLHAVVIEHLRKLQSFDLRVFPWNHNRRTLFVQFERIQTEAVVKAKYGFHDLRRAFATMIADRLTVDSLQALMRHKSYTTQRYINISRQLNPAVEGLYVPDLTRRIGKISV